MDYSFFAEIADARLHLDSELDRLDRTLDALISHSFADGPAQWMRVRLYEVSVLRDAIGRIHGDAADPRVALLVSADSPLADYLRGILAWSLSVVRAFDDLAAGLPARRADWQLVHRRLLEGSEFHLQHLVRPIRQEIVARASEGAQAAFHQTTEHLEELFWGAALLQLTLASRFSVKNHELATR
jgi:hypothetical protein